MFDRTPADTAFLPPGRPLLGELLDRSVVLPAGWAELAAPAREEIERCPDHRAQLRLLVRHDLLTDFQVDRVEAGDWPGLVLGNYRLLDRVGAGGMGVVYKAEHRLMRRPVAVKVLPRAAAADDPSLRRFFAEIQAVSQLQHPNIAAALDAGEAAGHTPGAGKTYYLVMEYVPGEDLEAHVRSHGPLPVARACGLVHQLADALAETHRRGLVHRDVKPSNVRLTPDGRVKLLDFGLALCRDSRHTRAGTPLGTPEYMAPEQATDAAEADARADVFGLGGVLFWCLTGLPPFPAKGNVLQVLLARATQPPPSLARARPGAPAALDAVVSRAMATDPAGRYHSAEAVMRALGPFLGTEVGPGPAGLGGPPARLGPTSVGTRACRVLIADDEPQVRAVCRSALERDGMACDEAADGPRAVQAVRAVPYDLLLLDVDMPGMSGEEVCRRVRAEGRHPHLKILMMSGRATADQLAVHLAAGADDFLPKPLSVVQLRARAKAAARLRDAQERSDLLNRHLAAVNAELERGLAARDGDLLEARSALVLAVAKVVAHRDSETGGHLLRLQRYVRHLAEAAAAVPAFAGWVDAGFGEAVAAAAPLHDIGKVGIPDRILLKPGKLDPDERAVMEAHTVIGHQILTEVAREHGFALALFQTGAEIARHHHERYDGTGYPDGLKGEDIPLAARLVAVADVYDALRSRRPYKPPFTHAAAVRVMTEGSPGHFDPALLGVFRGCGPEFARLYERTAD